MCVAVYHPPANQIIVLKRHFLPVECAFPRNLFSVWRWKLQILCVRCWYFMRFNCSNSAEMLLLTSYFMWYRCRCIYVCIYNSPKMFAVTVHILRPIHTNWNSLEFLWLGGCLRTLDEFSLHMISNTAENLLYILHNGSFAFVPTWFMLNLNVNRTSWDVPKYCDTTVAGITVGRTLF